VLPILSWFLKLIINVYYTRRVTTDDITLQQLILKQKSKIDELMRITNFYSTQALVNKYTKSLQEQKTEEPSPPKKPANNAAQRRPQQTPPQQPQTPQRQQQIQQQQQMQQLQYQQQLQQRQQQLQQLQQKQPPPAQQDTLVSPPTSPRVYTMPVPKSSSVSPYPTLAPAQVRKDPNRPWYDKFVDYVIGDVPEQMIPVICEKCAAPNGNAAREETPFIQFVCKSCGHFNDAQLQREGGKEKETKAEKKEVPKEEKTTTTTTTETKEEEPEQEAEEKPTETKEEDNK